MIPLLITTHIIISTIFLVVFCNKCTEMIVDFDKRPWSTKMTFVSIFVLSAYLWEITLIVSGILFYFTYIKE